MEKQPEAFRTQEGRGRARPSVEAADVTHTAHELPERSFARQARVAICAHFDGAWGGRREPAAGRQRA